MREVEYLVNPTHFICDYCKKEYHRPRGGVRCGLCLKYVYCSRDCQAADWATHRYTCPKKTN